MNNEHESRELLLKPIGYFHCDAKHPYDAARQPGLSQGSGGRLHLLPGNNYEQAVADLAGFERIWLLYGFHLNQHWKPLVQPPRGNQKVGVFASRAPYRPNPVGLSCVQLFSVHGLCIEVGPHDLLDGTPVYDIKPYLPYADSFPGSTCGWLDELSIDTWRVIIEEEARERLRLLPESLQQSLTTFALQQLSEEPTNSARKRVRPISGEEWELAYRTWRLRFTLDQTGKQVNVNGLYSGYSHMELDAADDPYGDKDLHRALKPGSEG